MPKPTRTDRDALRPRDRLCAYELELDRLLRGSEYGQPPQEAIYHNDSPLPGCTRTLPARSG